ncbi:MAG: hypothetical protein AB1374_08415 [Bacillota bacterium]
MATGDINIWWTANRVNSFVYNAVTATYYSTDIATRYDTLVKNPDDSYTLKRKDQSVYEFNAAGRLVELKNKYGQPLTLSYDAAGRLLTITEPISGRYLTISYNVYGLTSFTTTRPLSPAR